MELQSQVIRDIHDHLQDDESKFIFGNRLMYSITGNRSYLQVIIDKLPEAKWLKAEIEHSEENFIFGAGTRCRDLYYLAPDKWAGIINNDETKWGKEFSGGVTIVPPKELYAHPHAKVFLSVRRNLLRYQDEIVRQLTDMGIAPQRIVRVDRDVVDRWERYQYFDLLAMHPMQDEVFVDVGAFDGASTKRFAEWAGNFSHAYLFEPDPENRKRCERTLSELPKEKLTIYPYGLWKEKTELCFSEFGTSGGSVRDNGENHIPVVTLDETLAGKRVTYIKMDVEGAELEVLMGAQRIIQEQHPKLAISLYHKTDDIYTLPKYVLELFKDYRLYIRQYSLNTSEIVLYAI